MYVVRQIPYYLDVCPHLTHLMHSKRGENVDLTFLTERTSYSGSNVSHFVFYEYLFVDFSLKTVCFKDAVCCLIFR